MMAIVRIRWGRPPGLGFDRDLLHISPAPVAAGLAAAGFLCWLLGDSLPGNDRLINLALVLYLLAAIAWLCNLWQPRLARWFLVVAMVAVTVLAGNWLELSGGPFLLLLPIALAATLISLSAATLTAVGESMLLVFLSGSLFPAVNPATTTAALMGIWAMLGLMVATYDRIYWLGNWSWEQYQRARLSEEEAHRHQLELKQSLEDLAHANRQLTLLNDRLAAMRLIAEEAQRTKAAFVAKVSHEFRTPLNMIIGLTDLLVEKPKVYGERLPSALLDDLDIVRRNCEHLSEMINDVLDLSRAEVGHLTLHRERANLADLVAESFAVVRPLLVKKGLEFRTHIPADLPEVYCDRTRIRQVILNLVSNAARFTEKGGITVSLCRQGDYVTVSVKDTGPGIGPEDAKRVFEPFYQGTRKTAREGGGSGLGLSISKQFVELHGGRIWFDSVPGSGTTFSFDLPISPPLESAAGPTRWIAERWEWVQRTSKPDVPAMPAKERFVVCDATGELHMLFERYADEVEIVNVHTLPQALQELRRCPAHAVVLNAESPDRLWPLMENARQEMPDTPIIGCALPPRIKYALAAGAVDHLVKPVTRADLAKAIQSLGEPVRRVLVVDDDPHVLQLFSRMLTADDGSLEVISASGGREALELLHRFSPDLVLLDLIMPDMDGWQVLAAKSQDEAIRDIPVVLISAQNPAQQSPVSPALFVTADRGLSFGKVWRSTRWFSALLLEPD